MRPTTLAAFFALPLPLALAACAGGPPTPKEPTRLELTVRAAPTVNPDDLKRAAPIAVSVYELKTDGAFNAADFFTLDDQDKTVLADDLVSRERLLLRPGERMTLRRKIDPAATALGVVAAYRDLPNSVWRAAYPLPPAREAAWYRFSSPKLRLTIDLDTHAVRITETGK